VIRKNGHTNKIRSYRKYFNILKCFYSYLLIIFFLHGGISAAFAESKSSFLKDSDPLICGAYLTGIGCSNCSVTDPVLLVESTSRYPNLIILEFEIFHEKMANMAVKKRYFKEYLPGKRSGVPFFVLDKEKNYIGRLNVLKVPAVIDSMESNGCPLPNGKSVDFRKIDLTAIPAKFNIWTKNRVLISGPRGDNEVLKRIILQEDLSQALAGIEFLRVEPIAVKVSRAELLYENAIMIDGWRLQWNGDPVKVVKEKEKSIEKFLFWLFLTLLFLGGTLSFLKVRRVKKGAPLKLEWQGKISDCIIAGVSFLLLIVFFWLAKEISPALLEQSGYNLPLPLFTFIIALVDGFNPCNMFVLTCLLALLISTSSTRTRLLIVSISFIATVYIFYFTFMAAWLNVFKYVSFINPLRITLGLLALITGLINCKELFFFRKGFSLMIQDRHKGPLMRRIDHVKEVIKTGSLPLLIFSSLALASLASLIELPCTAGFPILYTGVLSARGLESTYSYYGYLLLYNLIYVMPLNIIIIIFIYTFRARQITQRHMEIIKFIGGIIMILLGIILLANPGLVGLSIK